MVLNKIWRLINTINPYMKEKDRMIAELKESMRECKLRLQKLQDEVEKKEKESYWEQYWNNKKPKTDIFYLGRVLPTTKTRLKIDVKLFVTPQDAGIHKELRSNNLYWDGREPLNQHILKLYKWHQKRFLRYKHDKELFGIPELWMFPHEMMAMKKGDCDDYANSLASFLIASGVPYWRVRVVAGTTYSGVGHLTVYVLGDDMKTWYHLNSTTPYYWIQAKKLEGMPTTNNPKDKLGIKDVWFSYNNRYAWSVFETSTAARRFKEHEKKIQIVL